MMSINSKSKKLCSATSSSPLNNPHENLHTCSRFWVSSIFIIMICQYNTDWNTNLAYNSNINLLVNPSVFS